jgi:ATP/maltotriose-dependent transcriptional regulator MalT
MLAGVCNDQGDLDAARRQWEAALGAARAAGNHRLVSINLNNLARFADEAGDDERAAALRAEAVAVAREGGDFWARAFHLGHLAWRALCDRALDDAERHAEERRRLLESYRSQRELPATWDLLAWIARARGDLDLAAERVATGLAIAESGGQTWSAADLCLTAGIIATERGDVSGAVDALRTRLRALDPEQHPVDISLTLDAWASLAARAGDHDRAARFHGAAVRALRDAGMADPPPFEVDVSRLRDALRDRPGAGWMQRAEAEGAAVPVATVIAEALAYVPPALEGAEAGEAPLPFGLSPREMEVLRLVADGRTDRQIAEALFISRRTAEWHVRNVLGKLGAANRAEAASRAARDGLL